MPNLFAVWLRKNQSYVESYPQPNRQNEEGLAENQECVLLYLNGLHDHRR